MSFSCKNIFTDIVNTGVEEEFLALFHNAAVKIERIVSRSHGSPPGFWYDQGEDEWVIVLRGSAALEFQNGEIVEMKEGDYLVIPRGVRHRVAWTGVETVWLAVHVTRGETPFKVSTFKV